MTQEIRTSQNSEKGRRFRQQVSTKESSQTLPPKFSFAKLHPSWNLNNAQREEKAALANTLLQIGSMTWTLIMQTNRHGAGFEKISLTSIKDSYQEYCREMMTEDTNLIAFRYYKKKPMVGYRDGETFFIMFFDREFRLYDHG